MKWRPIFVLGAFICVGETSADEAIDWNLALTLEAIHNTRGGSHRGGAELMNLDFTVALDTAALQWWQNGEWFIYLLADAGDNPSDLTGDVQGISNIAAPRAARVYEFWYRHTFADGDLNALFGLQDFNSVFYSLESAGLFTHASFGVGPDVSQVVPSIFPSTSLGWS